MTNAQPSLPSPAVNMNCRKRKKEVDGSAPPNINTNSFLDRLPSKPRVSAPLSLDHSAAQPQQSHNMSAPFLSFTSLLTDDYSAALLEQSDQIDHLIQAHAEQLRHTLAGTWQRYYSTLMCAAEERAAKRIKERERELESTARTNAMLEERAAHYRAEAHVWRAKVEELEETAASLMAALHEARMRGDGAATGWRTGGCQEAEDAESSYVDPERVEPVSLACRACGKGVATVMMWPCRHLGVCRRCDAVTKACPVCLALKTAAVEVHLV